MEKQIMRLSDEAAESLARTWAKERGKMPRNGGAGMDMVFWAGEDLPDLVKPYKIYGTYDRDAEGGSYHITEPAAYIALGHALNEAWLACGGEERVLAAVEAERERCARVADCCARERKNCYRDCLEAGGNVDALLGKQSEAERIAAAIRALPVPDGAGGT